MNKELSPEEELSQSRIEALNQLKPDFKDKHYSTKHHLVYRRESGDLGIDLRVNSRFIPDSAVIFPIKKDEEKS